VGITNMKMSINFNLLSCLARKGGGKEKSRRGGKIPIQIEKKGALRGAHEPFCVSVQKEVHQRGKGGERLKLRKGRRKKRDHRQRGRKSLLVTFTVPQKKTSASKERIPRGGKKRQGNPGKLVYLNRKRKGREISFAVKKKLRKKLIDGDMRRRE